MSNDPSKRMEANDIILAALRKAAELTGAKRFDVKFRVFDGPTPSSSMDLDTSYKPQRKGRV